MQCPAQNRAPRTVKTGRRLNPAPTLVTFGAKNQLFVNPGKRERREGEKKVVMGRVYFLRVRVEYESESVEYESSTSRVLRIHP